jgi:hypothetical protein
VRRGQKTDLSIDLPSGAATITIVSTRTYVPALVPGTLHRDRRELGVMLLHLEQRR